MLEGVGLGAGLVVVGGEGCVDRGGTCRGVDLGAVDLSPSINLLTVSDIFGLAGIGVSGRRGSGVLAN
mgnify:CR=1 FL=1